jgi:aminoglycoside phosphotransferase (APT) family kinase protein
MLVLEGLKIFVTLIPVPEAVEELALERHRLRWANPPVMVHGTVRGFRF